MRRPERKVGVRSAAALRFSDRASNVRSGASAIEPSMVWRHLRLKLLQGRQDVLYHIVVFAKNPRSRTSRDPGHPNLQFLRHPDEMHRLRKLLRILQNLRPGLDEAELAIDRRQLRPQIHDANVERPTPSSLRIRFRLAHHARAYPRLLPRRINRQRAKICAISRDLHPDTRDHQLAFAQHQEFPVAHVLPNRLCVGSVSGLEESLHLECAVDERNNFRQVRCRRLTHCILCWIHHGNHHSLGVTASAPAHGYSTAVSCSSSPLAKRAGLSTSTSSTTFV